MLVEDIRPKLPSPGLAVEDIRPKLPSPGCHIDPTESGFPSHGFVHGSGPPEDPFFFGWSRIPLCIARLPRLRRKTRSVLLVRA